jgi:hypothetical protein
MLQKIVDTWMKSDKASCKQVEIMIGKFNEVISLISRTDGGNITGKKSCYEQI